MEPAGSEDLSSQDPPTHGIGLRYYLRTKAAADAIKFTVEVQKLKPNEETAIKVGLIGTIESVGFTHFFLLKLLQLLLFLSVHLMSSSASLS